MPIDDEKYDYMKKVLGNINEGAIRSGIDPFEIKDNSIMIDPRPVKDNDPIGLDVSFFDDSDLDDLYFEDEVKPKIAKPKPVKKKGKVYINASALDMGKYTNLSFKDWKINHPIQYGSGFKIEPSNEIVITVDSSKHPESECIYYNSNWYHNTNKGVVKDVIDGTFHHIDTVIKVITKLTVEFGNPNESKLEFGYTTNKNLIKTIPIYSVKLNIDSRIVSTDYIEGWRWKEDYDYGRIIDVETRTKPIDQIKHYEQFKNFFNPGKNDIKTNLRLGSISPSYVLTEGIKYTFG